MSKKEGSRFSGISGWITRIFGKEKNKKAKKKKVAPEVNWLLHQNPKEVLSEKESKLKNSKGKAPNPSVNRKINGMKYPR